MRAPWSTLISSLALATTFALPAVAQDGGVPDTDGGVVVDVAASCTDDNGCGDGERCFQGFCYATCANTPTCDTLVGAPGACLITEQGATEGICITPSMQGQPCGGMLNAACDPTTGNSVCIQTAATEPGFCAVACDPANPSTCLDAQLQGAGACGCSGTQVCSTSPLGLQSGDGLCSEPNIDGSCGLDLENGVIELCTNGQQCAPAMQGDTSGTCTGTAEPDPEPSAEPSTGEPAAEPSTGEPAAEPSAGEPSAGEPSAGEPDDEPDTGRDEPEPSADTGGCAASEVPSEKAPFALAGLLLLGALLRRRR